MDSLGTHNVLDKKQESIDTEHRSSSGPIRFNQSLQSDSDNKKTNNVLAQRKIDSLTCSFW